MTIAVIDFGMGNIGSIRNMLKFVGAPYVLTNDRHEIAQCDKILLPGVGHFGLAMENLARRDLVRPLQDFVQDRRMPILGICLGMQLMCSSSEEGGVPGLGYIEAEVRRFAGPAETGVKVPHMGWSDVEFAKRSVLTEHLGDRARFYFVHSYYVTCRDPGDVLASTNYGITFASAFVRGNIAGVQFHPEKSHKYGIQLFRNFVESFGA
jgi:glutamine amidotransferase